MVPPRPREGTARVGQRIELSLPQQRRGGGIENTSFHVLVLGSLPQPMILCRFGLGSAFLRIAVRRVLKNVIVNMTSSRVASNFYLLLQRLVTPRGTAV